MHAAAAGVCRIYFICGLDDGRDLPHTLGTGDKKMTAKQYNIGDKVVLRDAKPLRRGKIVATHELDNMVQVAWEGGGSNWLDPMHLKMIGA